MAENRPGTIDPDVPLVQSERVAIQQIEGETVVAVPDRRETHLLNRTATVIWDLLAKPRTPRAIVERLIERYDADPDRIRTDCESVLRDLVAKEVVKIAIDTPPSTD